MFEVLRLKSILNDSIPNQDPSVNLLLFSRYHGISYFLIRHCGLNDFLGGSTAFAYVPLYYLPPPSPTPPTFGSYGSKVEPNTTI